MTSTESPGAQPVEPSSAAARAVEEVWRTERPHVLAALSRRHTDAADVEDAAQQALIAALEQWPREGVPDAPRGWLIRVASRRLIDQMRADGARRRREEVVARQDHAVHRGAEGWPADLEVEETPALDDLLDQMLRCCHPALSPSSRVALTLRAVGGLSTREIAAGFLVPEATMAQRISRARSTLVQRAAGFGPTPPAELPERLAAVRHVVSLVFTEGHQRSSGDAVIGRAFVEEAVRLARLLHRVAPQDPETAGLLSLLLLTHARSPARVDARGDLVPLDRQDRHLWDAALIREGVQLLEVCLPRGEVGAFQLQAAVAAVHAEAATAQDTDWPQIHALYRMLDAVAPSAATTLALATASAEVDGPHVGLALLDELEEERWHRVHAVRGHLLQRLEDRPGARASFATAARLTRSIPEQRYLNARIRELDDGA